MSNLPYFSICIPTHNRIHTLELTIRTVLAQTFDDYEIIVSDNASNPSAEALVKSFKDPRIRYFRHDSIINGSGNWEFAIQKARGEFLLLLADDDGLVPSTLERVAELTTKSQARKIQVGHIRYAHPKPGTPIEREGNRLLKSQYSGKVLCFDSLKMTKSCLSGWGIGYEKDPISFPAHPSGFFMGTSEVQKVIEKCGRLTTINCGDVGFLSAALQSKNLFFYDLPLAIIGVDISREIYGHLLGRRRDYDSIATYTDRSVFHAVSFTNLAVDAHLDVARKNLDLLNGYDIYLRNSFYINHGIELLQDRIWDRRKITDIMEWLQVVGKLPFKRCCLIIFSSIPHISKPIVISSIYKALRLFKQILSHRQPQPQEDTNWIDGREHGFSDIVSCALYVEKKIIPELA